ncbi:hypothetical protein ACFVMC_14975 [Nocardia sp. NPDC127579]|uniref:hypothetical protein n=1 Tax=Nocardia sp. NPDC127579 TaxID=3345402 RepID=UPI003645F150
MSALYTELAAYGPPVRGASDPAVVPMPIRLWHGDAELTLFSTVTTFGAAFDITLDQIAVEAYSGR